MLETSHSLCVFCPRPASDPRPWCPDNPGHGCQYGLAHEFPATKAEKPKQAKKADTGLCSKCGLHVRNPASAANGCAHEYPSS